MSLHHVTTQTVDAEQGDAAEEEGAWRHLFKQKHASAVRLLHCRCLRENSEHALHGPRIGLQWWIDHFVHLIHVLHGTDLGNVCPELAVGMVGVGVVRFGTIQRNGAS
jgi:hypothetical protein